MHYTDSCKIKICELLPLVPPSTRTWSSPPLRLPTIIPSTAVKVQTAEWALTVLEQLANMFLDFQSEFKVNLYTYRDIETTLNRAMALVSKVPTMRQNTDALVEMAEMARTARARFHYRHRRRHRRTYLPRDWYVEKLLFVWACCGGATRTSVKGKGSVLIRFLQLASEPVFRRCGQKLLTAHAAHAAVRKLLEERRPD